VFFALFQILEYELEVIFYAPSGRSERSRAVQAICIPLNFLMFSVVILRTGFPTAGGACFEF
jgi:hypothetical protein